MTKVLFLLAYFFFSSAGRAANTSKGTEFWLAFPANVTPNPGVSGTPVISLYLSADTASTGTVAIPGLGYSTPFSLIPGVALSLTLPSATDLGAVSDAVTFKGVHVTSVQDVTVYGFNQMAFSTDSYLGIPVASLGSDYLLMSYGNTDPDNGGTEFAVVAASPGTTNLTIVPSITAGARTAGVAYSVTLTQGQTYQLFSAAFGPGVDLSGTSIQSDQPVAVFGANQCAEIPGSSFCCCDHLVEQIPPTRAWGHRFLTYPLAGHLGGDTFRVMASSNGTVVDINGVTAATLNRGQFFETVLTASSVIDSCGPLLVAQYAHSTQYGGSNLGDPFMMLVPPYEQYLDRYTFASLPTGFGTGGASITYQNHVNIIAPTSSLASVVLDGSPVGGFTAIAASGFSGAQVAVASGSHVLTGSLPLGVFVYGWYNNYESYGHSGGASFAPVADASALSLAPASALVAVGGSHCLLATVTDKFSNPVAGVRVDFSVIGKNPGQGYAMTDAGGVAQYCYSGPAAGFDSVEASLGCASGSASVQWVLPSPTVSPTASPSRTPTPTATRTPSWTASPTVSATWSASPSFSQTLSFSETPSLTVSPTFSQTPTPAPQVLPGAGAGQVAKATLKIYNGAGEVVATLAVDSGRPVVPSGLFVQPSCFSPGDGRAATFSLDASGSGFTWDGFSDTGKMAGSGLYLAVVNVDGDRGPVYRADVCVVDVPAGGALDSVFLSPNPLTAGVSQVTLHPGPGLAAAGLVMEAQVYDVSGSKVAAMLPGASGTLLWAPGPTVAAGIYLVEVQGRIAEGRPVRRHFKLAVLR